MDRRRGIISLESPFASNLLSAFSSSVFIFWILQRFFIFIFCILNNHKPSIEKNESKWKYSLVTMAPWGLRSHEWKQVAVWAARYQTGHLRSVTKYTTAQGGRLRKSSAFSLTVLAFLMSDELVFMAFSTGKGTCHAGLRPEPQNPHQNGRAPDSQSCPLTSARRCGMHAHTHQGCTHNDKTRTPGTERKTPISPFSKDSKEPPRHGRLVVKVHRGVPVAPGHSSVNGSCF